MTIGIGFASDGGLLLCADTKVSGAIKENQSKIDLRVSSNGYCRIAFVMSGIDLNFPKSAVEKCWEFVQGVDFATDSMDTVAQAVEESLSGFYERYILHHPDRQPNAPYLQILVGIWLRNETRLYVSYETLFRRVDTYECIGSAAYLAKYLIQQYRKANPGQFDIEDAKLMATVAVRSAIEYDESCGGSPELLTITKDGMVNGPRPAAEETFQFVDRISDLIWRFHHNFVHLENAYMGSEVLESEFEKLIDGLRKLYVSVWFNW
jgi:hypothetical protein